VSREIAKHNADIEGTGLRMGRGGAGPVDGYTFCYGSGNATRHLGQRSLDCGRLLCNNNMKPQWYKYTKGTTITSDDISIRMTYDAYMTSDYISATTTYVMRRKEHVAMSVYSEEYTFTVLFCLLLAINTHPHRRPLTV
jgi:hypothetical protein